jgi:hypothetical protein
MLPFLRNCHTATLQLEMARDRSLAWRPRLLLQLHLLSCAPCRRYARQSQLLAQLVRPQPAPLSVRLSDAMRERLQQQLQEKGAQ